MRRRWMEKNRWVMLRGVWERCLGCHIVMRKKLVNWQVVQLEEHPGIEEKLCRFQSELKKMGYMFVL